MDETSFGTRSARGEWTPTRPAAYSPLFDWPLRPGKIARWVFAIPGFLFPWNALSALIAIGLYNFATPSRATAARLSADWVGFLLVRNLVIITVWHSLFHVPLYVRRRQDTRFKFNARWPRTSSRFHFGSQLRENVFWTLISGVPIWTAFEVLSLWLFANNHISWLSWSRHPWWVAVVMVVTPFSRNLHFYSIHRLLHAKRLYQPIHALHHRNTNPGPWSSLSMHPVEHILYFSCVAFHWVIPAHPVNAIFNLTHAALAPVIGHVGFEKIELAENAALDTSCLNHYLHHRYFEVNYSDGAIPLDRWFGSFHDGSPEAHERMKERLARRTPESVSG
jgi:sterol desaturase/sphingolipid hydroxylase (fatty acid hydroxylase superfamily)